MGTRTMAEVPTILTGIFGPKMIKRMQLKFGLISSTDPPSGRVRVSFDENGIVSQPLPILVSGTANKYFHSFNVNEQVACLMDENLENGVVLGAIYTNTETPGPVSDDVARVAFSDNTVIEYNRQSKVLVATVGPTELKITSAGGFELTTAGESLKTIIADLLSQLQLETHNVTAVGAPTGPPINAASYAAIATRLNNLFSG